MSKDNNKQQPEPVEQQAREQTGQQQFRLRIDERNMRTNYANAFRAGENADEVTLDFGINHVQPAASEKEQPEIIFQVNERIYMNFYSAKRLTITLGQLIRRYEQQFGEIELDANKRRIAQK
jgi:hypothetical protein